MKKFHGKSWEVIELRKVTPELIDNMKTKALLIILTGIIACALTVSCSITAGAQSIKDLKKLTNREYRYPDSAKHNRPFTIISPIENNHLWVICGKKYDLDTMTGKWKPLNKIIGKYTEDIHFDEIYQDRFNHNNVWFGIGYAGIIIYDIQKKKATRVKGFKGFVSSVVFDKDVIWIVSSHEGIYRYQRKSGDISPVTITKGLSIRSVVLYEGVLLIDGECAYIPGQNKILSINDPESIAKGYKKRMDELKSSENRRFKPWQADNGRYVYFVNGKSISQVEAKNAQRYDDIRKKINDAIHRRISKSDMSKDYIIKIKYLADFYRDIAEIEDYVGIEDYNGGILRINNSKDLEKVREFSQKTKDNLEKAVAYSTLAAGYVLFNQPILAKKYMKAFRKECPGNKVQQLINGDDEKKIIDAAAKYSEAMNEKMPDDKRLWMLGELFSNLACVSWNVNEGPTCNMAYPIEVYKKLLKKHPKSQYAAGAAYRILINSTWCCDESFSNIDCVKEYETYLKKYPKSEFASDAYIEIGSAYHCYLSEKFYDAPEGLEETKYEIAIDGVEKAKKSFEKALELKPDRHDKEIIRGYIRQVEDYLNYSYSLSLKSVQSIYKKEEPVILNFVLTNKKNDDTTIEMKQKSANFGVNIYKIEDEGEEQYLELIRNYEIDVKSIPTKKVILKRDGGQYSENITISKEHLVYSSCHDSYEYGYFDIGSPGKYKVYGCINVGEDRTAIIYSNTIAIEIKK